MNREKALQVEARRVGGMTFIKIGRITISFCVSEEYRPLGANAAANAARAAARKERQEARRHRAAHLSWMRGWRAACRTANRLYETAY